jgi:MFS family permease
MMQARYAILPAGIAPEARLLLAARGLRAIGDGLVSLLLPVYLLELGQGAFETGVIATATLAGCALLTLLVGLYAHRASGRSLLIGAASLMMLTGVAFATFHDFWPLLLVAFVGTLNPSSGDVSVFLPLEQAQLARMASHRGRTSLFARYSFVGSIAAAVGALGAAVPEAAAKFLDVDLARHFRQPSWFTPLWARSRCSYTAACRRRWRPRNPIKGVRSRLVARAESF